MFYNEEYLSKVFKSDKKENFFSFVPRRISEFIYVSTVSGVISYLIKLFFVEEERLKKIFLLYETKIVKLKYELSILVKSIMVKFIVLISISMAFSIFSFFYISCFNIVYPYSKFEWIKSSLFIIIVMQFLNFLLSLSQSILRFISIRFKNDKLFQLSCLLN